MTRRVFLSLLFAVVALPLGGCERATLNRGGKCSLNSDCTAPLVCGLERCRRQCVDSRDCGAGLLCLRVAEQGGVCQIEEEATCGLTSDCTDGLVCRFGTCTTACVEDRDCTPGALCLRDDDGPACNEPSDDLCVWDSDCPAPYSCGDDQQCRLECVEDRDCPAPRVCLESQCHLPDGGGP